MLGFLETDYYKHFDICIFIYQGFHMSQGEI